MKRMKILWAFLALCLLSGFANSQAEVDISPIRKEVESINKNAARFGKKIVKIDDLSTEGAEATVYREKNQIKKIVAQIYGETGRSALELYYKDERLIFAFEREYRYEKPFGKVLKIIPTRFYFVDEKLIKLLFARREIFADDEEYNALRDRMISVSKTIFDRAKAENKPN
jgi:hypothetical protein